jgi:hypothetical protein
MLLRQNNSNLLPTISTGDEVLELSFPLIPFWPGQPATAHWGFPDPSQVQGTDLESDVHLMM